jgi:hypothetical protein
VSTYYGYYCASCREESDHWFNHGQNLLQTILALWPAVDALEKRAAALPEGWKFLNVQFADRFESDVRQFLAEHYGHDLKIKSEYASQPAEEIPPEFYSPGPDAARAVKAWAIRKRLAEIGDEAVRLERELLDMREKP